MEGPTLAFGDDFRAGALDHGQEFFLFFVWDLKLVQRGFEIPDGGVEFRIGNMQTCVGGFHFFALVMSGATGRQSQELHKVFLELRDVLGRGVPGD